MEPGGKRPIRVLLTDDHTMFRESLARLLASRRGVEVVGQARLGAEALALARRTQPDVVITQLENPIDRSRQTASHLLSISPPPRVIVLTMFEDPELLREMLRLGASACVLKTASVEELVGAIHDSVRSPAGDHAVVSLPAQLLERTRKGSVLSKRELEILVLAARGCSNRQIAAHLSLAEATVKRHLANVYEKLGVSSRGQAANRALLEGWIVVGDILESG